MPRLGSPPARARDVFEGRGTQGDQLEAPSVMSRNKKGLSQGRPVKGRTERRKEATQSILREREQTGFSDN